jgi:hypothetical protein
LFDASKASIADHYDYVIAIMSTHMPFDQNTIDALGRSLKPNGALLVMALRNNTQQFFNCIRKSVSKAVMQTQGASDEQIFAITESDALKTMLTAASFKSIMMSESSCPLAFGQIADFYLWALQNLGNARGLKQLDYELKKQCLAQAVDEYRSYCAPLAQGAIRYDMPFVLVYAQK